MNLSFEELRPGHWSALEELFGENGACGGCWCQWWRVERGGRLWEETKGTRARSRMKELVETGKVLGILSFDDKRPVGWCSFGKRSDFPRLETVKAYRRDDTEGIWCINCFFVARGFRGKDMSRMLLAFVITAMKSRGVKVIEAYPVTTTRGGKKLAAAFSWTGPFKIFEEKGFKVVQRLVPEKPLVRLKLK